MTRMFSEGASRERMGRQIGQQANPFQQQPGEDRNVEQQAVTRAVQGPSPQQMYAHSAGQGSQQGGPMQIDQQLPAQSGQIPVPQGVDPSKWNTDGYAQPNQVAQSFGQAPAGWDPQKWADVNHQTPKYVSGRFAAEAGNLADPANRQKYLDNMKAAYGPENFRFDGKDKISIDGGRTFVDVFGGASAGIYSPAWQSMEAGGGAPMAMPAPPPAHSGSQNLMALGRAIQGGPSSSQPILTAAPAQGAPAGGGGAWTLDDFYSGRMEVDRGQNKSAQEWVDFFNRFRPKEAAAPAAPATPTAGPAPTVNQGAPPAPPGISQFSAPDQSGIENQQQALLQRILGNPHTLNSLAVGQLKERGKEEALAMQEQLEDQLAQNAASRGLSGGGFENANRRRLGESTLQAVLRGNRDVDLAKVAQDRSDELGALGAADSLLGNQIDRRTAGYGATLAGQTAEAERVLANKRFDLDTELGRGDLTARNRGLDIQELLGRMGIDVDNRRISEGGRQFDLSHNLALQEFAERMRQFNNQLGFSYNELSQRGQSDLIKTILGMN